MMAKHKGGYDSFGNRRAYGRAGRVCAEMAGGNTLKQTYEQIKPIITTAKREEIYEVSAFLNNCWRLEYSSIISNDYLDTMSVAERHEKLLKRFDENTSDFLIMRDNDEMMGAAVFGTSYTDGYPDDGEISAIYLRHDYIGQGYGHALFAEIERALSEKGYTKLVLDVLSDNERAVSFYKKHGYEIVSNSSIDLGGNSYPLTVFRKSAPLPSVTDLLTSTST